MKVSALLRSFHGHMAIEIIKSIDAPRRILIYFGNNPGKPIPVENELTMVLMASRHTARPTPAKKAAARVPDEYESESHCTTIFGGF
jgi:hypothetical protein